MIALAILAAALSSDPAQPIHVEGRFQVSYTPIYCVRAPCPPGTYSVVVENRLAGQFQTYTVDPASTAALPAAGPGGTEGDGIAIDGEVWIDPATRTARVLVREAMFGLWKTPVPGGGQTADGKPATLTLVNGTGDVIRGLFLAPGTADRWGADVTLESRQNIRIKSTNTYVLPTADCLYDIRIVLGDRPREEIRRQNVCTDPKLTADRSGEIIDRR
ncbi:hypothetical protein sos41_13480 [Alphaproteobacteria bacterium SO-S41]|nr:hypothetical protein sos41_13480 [Alphaproteobacteria bacterium SO-S41]